MFQLPWGPGTGHGMHGLTTARANQRNGHGRLLAAEALPKRCARTKIQPVAAPRNIRAAWTFSCLPVGA